MSFGLSDTDPDAERVQLDLLHRAGPVRRAQMAFSLSATVIDLARRAIRRDHPDATEQEIGLLFVEQNYGGELAQEMRRYFATRPR